MVLPQEKIVVIELNGIYPVGMHKVPENAFGASGGFHFFAASGKSDNTAEVTSKRTTDAGLMNCGATTQESRQNIFFGRNTVIRIRGELIGISHRAFRVVAMFPFLILV
jgi:hypothetical protein